MAETAQNPVEETPKADPRAERRTARLTQQIHAFARSHGGGAEANIAYIGGIGTRIVLVGENGEWGDLVAPTYAMAREAVERSGVTVHEDFDGEFAARVRTGPYEWSRMAGIQIGGPDNKIAAPETAVAEPETAVAEPETAVASPGTTAGGPGTTVADPGTTVAEPGVTAGEPGATTGDGSDKAGEPGDKAGGPSNT